MLQAIRSHTADTSGWTGRHALSERVMHAISAVPRDEFVPPERRYLAWDDSPLPIGRGQTISQPFIVAVMTDLLELEPGASVLEIGTGCGYQTAVLAAMGCRVHTVERICELAEAARVRLERLGYEGIHFRIGDGYDGWSKHAPYDGILVAAGATDVPDALVGQLAPGGRMIIPAGIGQQYLVLVEMTSKGPRHRRIFGVSFVPMLRGTE